MGKGAGCLAIICSIYLMGGVRSETSINNYKNSSDSWLYAYYRSKGVNLLTWPKMFFCKDYSEQREFKENYFNVQRKLGIIKNSIDASSPQYLQISSLERELSEGGVVIENAEKQIEFIGDSFLGNGKSAQIFGIVEGTNSGQINPEQAARQLIGVLPSGLSPNQDRFVKGAASKILTNILQQGPQKPKKPYSEE